MQIWTDWRKNQWTLRQDNWNYPYWGTERKKEKWTEPKVLVRYCQANQHIWGVLEGEGFLLNSVAITAGSHLMRWELCLCNFSQIKSLFFKKKGGEGSFLLFDFQV